VYFSPDGKKHKDGPFQGQCAAVKHMRTSKASIKMVLQEGTFVMSKKPNVLVENANGAGRFSLLDLNECPPPFARPVN
jgi:N-acetylmuramic acid 6-phosphate (MurNAc-6-P) etherase